MPRSVLVDIVRELLAVACQLETSHSNPGPSGFRVPVPAPPVPAFEVDALAGGGVRIRVANVALTGRVSGFLALARAFWAAVSEEERAWRAMPWTPSLALRRAAGGLASFDTSRGGRARTPASFAVSWPPRELEERARDALLAASTECLERGEELEATLCARQACVGSEIGLLGADVRDGCWEVPSTMAASVSREAFRVSTCRARLNAAGRRRRATSSWLREALQDAKHHSPIEREGVATEVLSILMERAPVGKELATVYHSWPEIAPLVDDEQPFVSDTAIAIAALLAFHFHVEERHAEVIAMTDITVPRRAQLATQLEVRRRALRALGRGHEAIALEARIGALAEAGSKVEVGDDG